MRRTGKGTPDSNPSVHDNRRSTKPRRRWKLPHEYDRSMRAYELNPRALAFACNPCECGGSDDCRRCAA